MIRQLMKLDPAWLWLPFVLLAGVFLSVLNGHFAFWNLLLIAGVIAADRQPDNSFHASLPVAVRPVLVARSLSVLALIWLPLLTCGYFLVANRNSDMKTGTVLAFGSVITLVLLWIQTTRVQGRAGQSWLIAVPFAIWIVYTSTWSMFSGVPSGLPDWLYRESGRASAPITAICGFLTAALFLLAFITAPKSFMAERAEAEPSRRVAGTDERAGLRRRFALAGIIFPFGYFWILYFLTGMATGLRLKSFDVWIFGIIYLSVVWNNISPKIRWISFLPVPPGGLLAAILLPALVGMAAGYAIGVHLPVARLPLLKNVTDGGIALRAVPGMRDQIFSVILLAAAMMLTTLVSMSDDWHRMHRLSTGTCAVLRVLAIIPCAMLFSFQHDLDLAGLASSALPASSPIAIAVAIIPLILIYWGFDAMFRQLEFVDKHARGSS